jgi:hypothetical protein
MKTAPPSRKRREKGRARVKPVSLSISGYNVGTQSWHGPRAGGEFLESSPDLGSLLSAAEGGDKAAADALFSALYAELRRLAKYELARHGAPVSLSATTLLHKAYMEPHFRIATGSWAMPPG